MGIVSISTAKNAKQDGADRFTKSVASFPAFEKIVSVIKTAWPKKTAAHVSFLTGVSERAVKFWLAGETRMTLEHVAALLKTDEGFAILKAIMGDCKVEWWIVAQANHSLHQSKKAVRVEQKRSAAIKAQLDMLSDQ